jgi:hypothetical protein
MYITEVVRPYPNGKASRCILLRESYRRTAKLKTAQPAQARTTAQSSAAPSAAMAPAVTVTQGLSIGAVATVYQVAQPLGIRQVLGNSRQGKLALWQVIARVIQPGSCLASVRLAREHAACDLVRLTDSFCEDDLYANLA